MPGQNLQVYKFVCTNLTLMPPLLKRAIGWNFRPVAYSQWTSLLNIATRQPAHLARSTLPNCAYRLRTSRVAHPLPVRRIGDHIAHADRFDGRHRARCVNSMSFSTPARSALASARLDRARIPIGSLDARRDVIERALSA